MKKLNVDPAFELEELIIESKPIHKKEQRLSKTVSMDNTAQHVSQYHPHLQENHGRFKFIQV